MTTLTVPAHAITSLVHPGDTASAGAPVLSWA